MAAILRGGRELRYTGLEQFPARGSYGGVDHCIAGARPYALEFANESDVICLLLGDIFSEAGFEDDGEETLLFRGETAAFHPRHGSVRVAASTVRHGFIAFSYSDDFQGCISDRGLDRVRSGGSVNNIRLKSLRHLACYARERLRFGRPLDPLEIQYLGGMVYIETLRGLHAVKPANASTLSDAEFDRLSAFIDAELEGDISCARLTGCVDLPLRVVFEGIKTRTGLPPYQFVLRRRVEQAQKLLMRSDFSIAEIAFRCGFASQQHMTSVLKRQLGHTPGQIRRATRARKSTSH
ncbi:AraC family transcriptional regulator [Sinorhizobium kostiense]|uniref:AraC family transcriptional regulator n=1 Tax=Sinorhizobium kostiense TaxID=76747 RepID=A0ABS4R3Y9_9HYPH|nr:AraC family transcriptional regulator [Sinorhizobium kostiense]